MIYLIYLTDTQVSNKLVGVVNHNKINDATKVVERQNAIDPEVQLTIVPTVLDLNVLEFK